MRKCEMLMFYAGFICLLGMCGCDTVGTDPGSGSVKTRGVYTTLALQGHSLDMPDTAYLSHTAFGQGQAAAAVVVGYGSFNNGLNQPEAFELELTEAQSGRVVLRTQGGIYAGRAAIQRLPIRKSGDYRLKLLINHTLADTWNFSVTRAPVAEHPAPAGHPSEYAQGAFGISLDPVSVSGPFSEYDRQLIQAILSSVQRQARKEDPDIFAQVEPGQVTARVVQKESGALSEAVIVDNTLTEELGQFFLRALQGRSTYGAWPAAAREVNPSAERTISVIFRYD